MTVETGHRVLSCRDGLLHPMRQTETEETTMFKTLRMKLAEWLMPNKHGSIAPTSMETCRIVPDDGPYEYGKVGFESGTVEFTFALLPEDYGTLATMMNQTCDDLERRGWDCRRDDR